MADRSPLDYIFGGRVDQGLALMREGLASKRTPSTITSLGIEYLWLKRYATAWKHYQHAIETYPYTMDGFYKEAGVAKWCLNEPEITIQQWQLGLRATCTEGAGGVSSALLLFAASILRPEVTTRKDAEQFLTTKVQSKSPFAKNWPNHLGKFMLGVIDGEALREACIGVRELDTDSRNWETRFYEDILAFADGDILQNKLRERMRKRGTISHPETAERQRVLSIYGNQNSSSPGMRAFVGQASPNFQLVGCIR